MLVLVLAMDVLTPLHWFALALGLGFLLWRLSRSRVLDAWAERALREVPRSTIANIQPGQRCRLVGTVVGFEPTVRSPLMARECVGYQLRVSEVGYSERQLLDESNCAAFVLDDTTGRVVVHAHQAQLLLVPAEAQRCGLIGRVDPRLRRVFAQRPGTLDKLWGPGVFRYSEGALCEGDQVAVVGEVRREPIDDRVAPLLIHSGGYREASALVLGGPQHSVHVSNRPRLLGIPATMKTASRGGFSGAA